MIRDLGLTNAKPSKLPGSKEEHKRAGGGPRGAGVYPLLFVGGATMNSHIGGGKGRGAPTSVETSSVPSATKGAEGTLADATPHGHDVKKLTTGPYPVEIPRVDHLDSTNETGRQTDSAQYVPHVVLAHARKSSAEIK